MARRKRRSFTPEFRAEAVKLVREGSKSLPQVAKDLDLTESALRNWVREADGGEDKESAGALSTAEREELVRLRKEVRHLERVHQDSRGAYGSPRVHAELRAHGQRVSRKRVARLMSEHGLAARKRRRFVRTTDSRHNQPVAPNILTPTSPPTSRPGWPSSSTSRSSTTASGGTLRWGT